jgi:pimeloyl-ACP methyl ester carboxylesterase
MLKTVYKDGVPLGYYDSGSGDTLVFLHGHLESQEIWESFTSSFEKDYRILRIDLPGHGGSGIFGSISGMEVMAEAVRFILECESIQKAHIFGHSMGGYTALAALELFPGIFKSICLFHSHPRPDSQEVAKKREREIKIMEKGQKRLLVNQNIPNMYATDNLEKFQDAVNRSKEIAHKLDERGVIAAVAGMKVRPDRSEILKNANIPCKNIIGKKDNYIDFEMVSLKTELPARSMKLILEESGHMGFIEEPYKARKGIYQFLNSIG